MINDFSLYDVYEQESYSKQIFLGLLGEYKCDHSKWLQMAEFYKN